MKKLNVIMMALSALIASSAFANPGSELDNSALPQGLIVRQDEKGNREVFKFAADSLVSDNAAAEKAVASFVKADNKLDAIQTGSELDQTSSTDSWYCRYQPYYYNYGSYYYSYYSYQYASYTNYYPYYSYYNGGYSYYYYYSYSYYYGRY